MRIIIDVMRDVDGNHLADLCCHTERVAWNKLEFPVSSGVMIDAIDFLKGLHSGTIPIAGTGWDTITQHPLYPGKRRIDALAGEIVRLNDVSSKLLLGL